MSVVAALCGNVFFIQPAHRLVCGVQHIDIKLLSEYTDVEPDPPVALLHLLACLHAVINQVSNQDTQVNIGHRKLFGNRRLIIHLDLLLYRKRQLGIQDGI